MQLEEHKGALSDADGPGFGPSASKTPRNDRDGPNPGPSTTLRDRTEGIIESVRVQNKGTSKMPTPQ